MPYAEVPAFMEWLRAIEGTAARALEFLILTATRMSEMRHAKWSEIEGDVWTIPAERMKMRKPHRVPLVPRALEILKELRGQHDTLVFPGRLHQRPIDDNTVLRVLARLAPDTTAHGFRSSFRDWAGERTSFPKEIAEAALAHAIKSSVERAYLRTSFFDHRRRLMTQWAGYCGEQPVKAGGKVVAIRAA
jgi:integrase